MSVDPWRYRCPEGHTSWTSRNPDDPRSHDVSKRYYCQSCDDHYDQLVDMKRDRLVDSLA